MKIVVVLGTRPEIVKMSPVVRELEARGLDYFILHTGQHYDYSMDSAFFEELNLPPAGVNLGVGSCSHAEQTAKIMVGVERTLTVERPDIVLVQGDTNTVLSGALVAAKMRIRLGHVEAGLRSYDRRMPEEINRVVADHLSNQLFAPTEVSRRNLLKEGISADNISVTGNTVVDAVEQNLLLSREQGNVPARLGLGPRFFLVTLHRAENVDNKAKLKTMLSALKELASKHSVDVVFPVHPRTKKMIGVHGLSTRGLWTLNPLGSLDFLQLESRADLVLTDSGGVQEEACILRTPCVTLRDNTERPETVEVGANVVAGTSRESILRGADRMLEVERRWANPFGDGNSGKKIVDILLY